MRSTSAVISALVIALAAAPAVAGAQPTPAARAAPGQKRAFTLNDWYRVTTLSTPAVSPDGRLVAVTVTTVKEAENKRHSEVWVVPAAGCPSPGARTHPPAAGTRRADGGCEPARYTSPNFESSNPSFSPDGKYLFFTSQRQGGKGTRWALRMDQPAGEAFQVAHYPPGTASLPRDRRFAVWTDSMETDSTADSTKKQDLFAKMGATARPPFGAVTRPVDPVRFDGRHIVDMGYKANNRGFLPNRTTARQWRPSQIWYQTTGDTAKRMLTRGPYSHDEAAVSPDGKWVAFVADSRLRPDSVVSAERDSLAKLPYDRARDDSLPERDDIFVWPMDCLAEQKCGQPRRITHLNGNPSDLAWSPDGRQISFIARPGRTQSARIYLVSAAGGEPENVLGDWRYEPAGYVWLPSGEIFFNAEVGGRTGLFVLTPKTGRVREVVGGRRRLSGLAADAARRTVAYVATSLDRPTELYVANVDGTGERKLTEFNRRLNAEVAWSDAERFTYKSVGDLEVEGWLMKPHGYQPGKRYPLVLYIHGGPHSAYGENWFDEFQNLAGAGMMVLFTNPRGSSGYGADFTYSTRGRWGAEDYQDLMKAVDIAAQRPDVDSTRMGVTGGSYGGFMTAWITTRTARFKAAQADRMISDWTFWYGASDAQGLTEFEFFGKPWENVAMYDSLSPIRRVDKVRTPTLIVQSEEDYRTPMGNAELWFMALKKRGVPVELVRYPRSTHELSRSGEPWLLVDRLGRLRQWFGYWLMDQKPTVTANAAGRASR